ncbi:MAG: hypothetical protein IPO90_01930 [Flavobacteriales bacterium]|nr:hypothetical protein [Flavobacteriales bacterium]
MVSGQADQTIEKDLLNSYSLTGINFKNVANNDRSMRGQHQHMDGRRLELTNVTTGVQSNTTTTASSSHGICSVSR